MKKYLILLALAACNPQTSENVVTNSADQTKQVAKKSVRAKLADKVNFAFDSSSLSYDAKQDLLQTAAWLNRRGNSSKDLVIEGHCDERGTREYNLALGERRAYTVKKFLSQNGVSAKRLKTVSYGEEKPAAVGASEKAYAKNRRAELKVK